MIKEIISTDNLYKAVIIHRKDGLFQIDYYKRTKDVVPEFNFEGEYFWEPFTGNSLTDSLTEAEKLAQDQIKAWQV
jgi:hypothetical protein